jgi:tetratricopeptide (TPR) repeat protein
MTADRAETAKMPKWTLQKLLGLTSIEGLNDKSGLEAIGLLVDLAGELNDPDLTDRALRFADDFEARDSAARHKTTLEYFRANAWSSRYSFRRADSDYVWDWEQPELREVVLHLRRALIGEDFKTQPVQRRCEILTNLGNVLSTLGRFVEANTYWTRALAIEPRFWMARGNRGRGLWNYLSLLYDLGHQRIFAFRAHGDLLAALAGIERDPGLGNPAVAPEFGDYAAKIGRALDIQAFERTYTPDRPPLGEDADYRHWALSEALFLNPLNDADRRPIAARDVLTLPGFKAPIDEPPVLFGFFNQLKQEYVSARWLHYEGLQATDLHPSDRDVVLTNTLDYPSYGLGIEKLRIAYRMAYSLLDKVAYFLNRYLDLGIDPTKVYFHNIWREKPGGPIRPQLASSRNLPFRGLYWLSKDIFEPGVREVTEPDAEALRDLRVHLEHKYVKVHDMGPFPPREGGPKDLFFDDLAYALSRTDLEAKGLRMLKLARAALIYLVLGMHQEERRRADAKDDGGGLVVPMEIGTYPDERKT